MAMFSRARAMITDMLLLGKPHTHTLNHVGRYIIVVFGDNIHCLIVGTFTQLFPRMVALRVWAFIQVQFAHQPWQGQPWNYHGQQQHNQRNHRKLVVHGEAITWNRQHQCQRHQSTHTCPRQKQHFLQPQWGKTTIPLAHVDLAKHPHPPEANCDEHGGDHHAQHYRVYQFRSDFFNRIAHR